MKAKIYFFFLLYNYLRDKVCFQIQWDAERIKYTGLKSYPDHWDKSKRAIFEEERTSREE